MLAKFCGGRTNFLPRTSNVLCVGSVRLHKRVLAAEDFNPVPVLSNRGEPVYGRVREYAQAGFSGRRMRLLEPVIRARCETLVDDMMTGGAPAEFTSSVGHKLPGETIYRLVGFPETDDDMLMG